VWPKVGSTATQGFQKPTVARACDLILVLCDIVHGAYEPLPCICLAARVEFRSRKTNAGYARAERFLFHDWKTHKLQDRRNYYYCPENKMAPSAEDPQSVHVVCWKSSTGDARFCFPVALRRQMLSTLILPQKRVVCACARVSVRVCVCVLVCFMRAFPHVHAVFRLKS